MVCLSLTHKTRKRSLANTFQERKFHFSSSSPPFTCMFSWMNTNTGCQNPREKQKQIRIIVSLTVTVQLPKDPRLASVNRRVTLCLAALWDWSKPVLPLVCLKNGGTDRHIPTFPPMEVKIRYSRCTDLKYTIELWQMYTLTWVYAYNPMHIIKLRYKTLPSPPEFHVVPLPSQLYPAQLRQPLFWSPSLALSF